MNRNNLLTAAGLGLIGLSSAQADDPPANRPNIIFCMTDDQGWGDVSWNGCSVPFPALDAMAANGMRFDNFYSSAPVCTPTRGGCLTGRHPNRYGIFKYGISLDLREQSIAEILRDHGYATGHFGKWHLNGISGPGRPVRPTDSHSPDKFGFDVWASTSNYIDLYDQLGRNDGSTLDIPGDTSDAIMDEAISFIRNAATNDQPFFSVIWYTSPHAPSEALPDDYAAGGNDHYFGELVAVDRSIGVLRSELRTLGIETNTILWFCSDNGSYHTGSNAELKGGKKKVWEGGIRVPGIIEWPARISGASTTTVTASTSDIFPTLLDALDLETERKHRIDGISLLPVLDGVMQVRPEPLAFWYHDATTYQTNSHAALIDGNYKLHLDPVGYPAGTTLLYDLSQDLSETTDLSSSEPGITSNMLATLEAWQASVERSFDEGYDYDEDGDGMPDWWETEYYGGETNANPTATASNGVNTVLETYIAGLDPTDPQSAFLISDLSPLTSGNVLSWNTTNDRVYSVYWASNLLSGFQPLETNVAVPFTDTNHPADGQGFYKIEVELE